MSFILRDLYLELLYMCLVREKFFHFYIFGQSQLLSQLIVDVLHLVTEFAGH